LRERLEQWAYLIVALAMFAVTGFGLYEVGRCLLHGRILCAAAAVVSAGLGIWLIQLVGGSVMGVLLAVFTKNEQKA